jgi:hypothetical protein
MCTDSDDKRQHLAWQPPVSLCRNSLCREIDKLWHPQSYSCIFLLPWWSQTALPVKRTQVCESCNLFILMWQAGVGNAMVQLGQVADRLILDDVILPEKRQSAVHSTQ